MRITVQPADYRYRDHQFQVWEGDLDLDVPIGSGATPEAAIEDLLWHLGLDELPADAVVEVAP
jgi:hypothetical protein